jgi:redox-sensitive bicupin YhaK (pirin superfamily)
MLYKAERSIQRIEIGPFSIAVNLPGQAVPGHGDRGYGPLARFDESILEPGTFIEMHEHRNDEIISYVTDGVMYHSDRTGAQFPISSREIMVMNAGKSFWHEERTKPDGETAKLMQIFVRPHTVNLNPSLQLKDLGIPAPNIWRFLVGPEGSDAQTTIRNDLCLYDIHLAAGIRATVPCWRNWDTLVHVYRGSALVNGTALEMAEGALLVDEQRIIVKAETKAVLLVFLINRNAKITKSGTIGG